MVESLTLTLTVSTLGSLMDTQVGHGARQWLFGVLLPGGRVAAISCKSHVDGTQPPGPVDILLLLLGSSLKRRHGATAANKVGVVSVDIRSLDADQTLNIVRCRSQALTEKIRDNLDQFSVESGESGEVLK